MVAVQTLGQVVALEQSWTPGMRYGVTLYNQYSYDYATLYRTQPNVRTCVDFIARNIAQLGLHVFQRVSETDRKRLRDHPLARLIVAPNPFTTSYRLIESLMGDLGIYFNAYWMKVKNDTGIYILRVPPTYVTPTGGLAPTSYEVNLGALRLLKTPAEMVHFRGYSPESAFVGLSPLETLRRVLAEEFAMGDYREHFWQNSARMSGLIERPAEAPEWSETARARFLAEFQALYGTTENAGTTAVLEEGMTWKQASFTAQESEYLAGRKLTREECARAYHIPLPMVGILDHATFSNIREQHKQLYQDCLGPWLAMLEQEIELQLLRVDWESESDGVYCEFNIAEKLQGSFEEQAAAVQQAVGRPWMTANEARGKFNMPSLGGDADLLVTPLNMMVGGLDEEEAGADAGGQAALPGGKGCPAHGEKAKRDRIDPTQMELRAQWEQRWAAEMGRTFRRQQDVVLGQMPKSLKRAASADLIWNDARWNRELRQDILRLNVATARAWGDYVARQMDAEFDPDPMTEWLDENARIASEEINATTKAQLGDALTQDDPLEAVKHLFEIAITVRALGIATSKVTTASVFGSTEAAKQTGLKTKTWRVNSSNPRPEHAAMNGETVGIGELFSNGMRWPGDPAGGAENNANCNCSCEFGRE
jgi:HK97 family phage portal protein